MRVAGRHYGIPVPHQRAGDDHRLTAHYCMRGKRVSKIVQPDVVGQPGLATDPHLGAGDIGSRLHGVTRSWKHPAWRRFRLPIRQDGP